MKKYKALEILVLDFAKEDVLCASGEVMDNEAVWKWEIFFN